MLRFKQFAGTGAELEAEVNTWLDENEPDVTQMVQTVDDHGTVTISFLFEESFRGQELRYAVERGMTASTEPPVPASTVHDEPVHLPMEP